MKVADAYSARYGSGDTLALCILGGNPDVIFSRYEARIGERDPLVELLGMSPTSVDDLAEGAYREIRREIERLYMRNLSRADVDAMVKALELLPNGKLTIHEGMEYNDHTLVYAWEKSQEKS